MRSVIGTDSYSNGALVWLHQKLSTWWARYVLYPLLVSAPVGLVAANFSEPPLRNAVQSWQPSLLTQIINEYPFIAFVLAFGYIAIISASSGLIEHFGKNEIDPIRLVTLLRLIRQIVSQKTERFEEAANRFSDADHADGEIIFSEITQPEQQIAACVHALYSYLAVISNHKVDFRVALATVQDGELDRWFCCSPTDDPPATSIDVLNRRGSAIRRALDSKSIVIVEDTAKADTSLFARTRPGGINENGSLLCAPVKNGRGEIPFLVSISCDESNYFKKRNLKFYAWMLRHFSLRIRLEHSLLSMKHSISR